MSNEIEWESPIDPGELPPPYFTFKDLGDQLVGYFTRTMEVQNNFDATKKDLLYIFATKDVASGKVVEKSINPNADLKRKLAQITVGKFIKVAFTDTLDTGKASPMKVFTVTVAKNAPAYVAAPRAATAPAPKTDVPF